jgi:hypothetical protein
MPAPVLTAGATITCIHGGQVTLIPRQASAFCAGAPLLCVPDLVGAPIVGCPVIPSPTTKPCTTVIATMPGSFSPKLFVGGRPAYLSTLVAVTDSVPPGSLIVIAPGQLTTTA